VRVGWVLFITQARVWEDGLIGNGPSDTHDELFVCDDCKDRINGIFTSPFDLEEAKK